MRPLWLIQDFQDEDSYNKLAKEVTKQGMKVQFLSTIQEEMEQYVNNILSLKSDPGYPIIVQASMNAVKYVQKQHNSFVVPGPWTTWDNYNCSKYYPEFGQDMLNNNCVIIPRHQVLDKIEELFDKIGDGQNLFIRPNSGYKFFTGQLLNRSMLRDQWQWIDMFTFDDTLLVVSSPKVVNKEIRFIVCNDKVITGSIYNKNNDTYEMVSESDDSWFYAQSVIDRYKFRPDPIFVLDVCLSKHYNVLELNSFSCAGLYACDLEVIVKHASHLAVDQFRSKNNA